MIRRALALTAFLLVPATIADAAPLAGGTAKLGAKKLQIRSGQIENGEGVVNLKGSLRVAGERLRAPKVDLRAGGAVTAKVDGLRQPVFAVRTGKARVGTNPAKIRIRKVKLRPTGALRGVRRTFGFSVKAVPRLLRVAGGQTAFAFTDSFRAELGAEQITPAANEGATIDAGGRVQMPIRLGKIILGRRLGGALNHGGGISFAKENFVELRLTDLKLRPRPPATLLARINDGPGRTPIATVDLSAPSYSPNEAFFADSSAVLTPEGSSVLNTELGTGRFDAGMPFGILAVTAVIQ